MDFNSVSVGQIVVFITSTGVICGFLFKIFSLFSQVKQNTQMVKRAHERLDSFKKEQADQKTELIDKVEQTNTAVNLICSAVSALIDDALQNNEESKDQLRKMKHCLDNKKEII